MTNLFRRDLAASLLIRGEAWNNRRRSCDWQSDRRADHVVEDGMPGRRSGV